MAKPRGREFNLARNTEQRRAIRRVMQESGRPLSPREILNLARAEVPGLGIATVYRAVKGLVADGWVRVVDLPGAPSRYEVTGKGHHHHFHCRTCDRLYEVDECPGALRDLAPPGFTVHEHEIILYGVCAGCAGPT